MRDLFRSPMVTQSGSGGITPRRRSAKPESQRSAKSFSVIFCSGIRSCMRVNNSVTARYTERYSPARLACQGTFSDESSSAIACVRSYTPCFSKKRYRAAVLPRTSVSLLRSASDTSASVPAISFASAMHSAAWVSCLPP